MGRQRRRAGGREWVRAEGNRDRQEGRESSEVVEAGGSERPEEASMEKAAAVAVVEAGDIGGGRAECASGPRRHVRRHLGRLSRERVT